MKIKQICNICKENKDIALFRKGRHSCIDCGKKKYKEWASGTGIKKVRECNNRYYHNNKNTVEYKYLRYKTGSHQRNIHFQLSLAQFKSVFKKPCVYCGDIANVMGLDRIDSNLGYVIDNVCSCCKRCNVAKNDMTVDEFINLCKKIVKHNAIT